MIICIFQISVVRDLPVGARLTDRVRTRLHVDIRPELVEQMRRIVNDPMQFKMYLENGTGEQFATLIKWKSSFIRDQWCFFPDI